MTYRHRSEATVKYERLGEYLAVMADYNRVARQRGWPAVTVLSPITGASNRVVLDIIYPDLQAFEGTLAAFRRDEEARSVWHRTADLIVERTAFVEVLEEIDLIE